MMMGAWHQYTNMCGDRVVMVIGAIMIVVMVKRVYADCHYDDHDGVINHDVCINEDMPVLEKKPVESL